MILLGYAEIPGLLFFDILKCLILQYSIEFQSSPNGLVELLRCFEFFLSFNFKHKLCNMTINLKVCV